MSSEWIETTLGEFIRLQRGHDLTSSEQLSGNVPVMGSAGHNGWHNQAKAAGPGVVVGRSGSSMGRVHYCPVDFWPHNTCLYVTDFLGNNPKFVYYFLKTLDLDSYNSGSAQASLNRNLIYSISLIKPPRKVQDEVAEIIGSLDDRIALLRETNATLEAIAQALFKSWFVDFDPVYENQGANAAAVENKEQAPSLPPEIKALFPATFIESPQGPIPEGWRIGSIYDIASITYGAPFASKQFNTEQRGLPLIRIRDLKDEKPGVYTEEVHPKGYLTQPGDLVVGMDGEFRAYLWGGEPAWLNQRVCVFKPQVGYSTAFVNYTIKPQLARVEATEIATTVIHLGKNDIDRFSALIPNEHVQKAFSAVVTPIFDQIVEGKLKAQNLANLRDTLLPRLISGQLRLPEAEQAIAAITD